MPGTPPTSPRLHIPRYADTDGADFAACINPIVDAIDPATPGPTVGVAMRADPPNAHAASHQIGGSDPLQLVPSGTIAMYGGASAPAGWLLCQGQSLSRASYPNLFAAIGTTYGAADGNSFSLPNMTGCVAVGPDPSSSVLPTYHPSLGGRMGEEMHGLSGGEMPSHAHSISDPSHNHGADSRGTGASVVQSSHNHSVSVGDAQHVHAVTMTGQGLGTPGFLWGGSTSNAFGSGTAYQAQHVTLGTDARSANISVSLGAASSGDYLSDPGHTHTIYGAYTGISGTAAAGGGAVHNNMQPSVALNFIIRT